jgi:hypothetical protein
MTCFFRQTASGGKTVSGGTPGCLRVLAMYYSNNHAIFCSLSALQPSPCIFTRKTTRFIWNVLQHHCALYTNYNFFIFHIRRALHNSGQAPPSKNRNHPCTRETQRVQRLLRSANAQMDMQFLSKNSILRLCFCINIKNKKRKDICLANILALQSSPRPTPAGKKPGAAWPHPEETPENAASAV